MSYTPEVIRENRRKAVEYLKTTEEPQGFGMLYDPATTRYCALGHMGLAVGIDASGDEYCYYSQIEDAFGLDNETANEVLNMNDDAEAPLPRIADHLAEKWGIG